VRTSTSHEDSVSSSIQVVCWSASFRRQYRGVRGFIFCPKKTDYEKPPIDESGQEDRSSNSGFLPESYETSGYGQIPAQIRQRQKTSTVVLIRSNCLSLCVSTLYTGIVTFLFTLIINACLHSRFVSNDSWSFL